MRKVRKQTLAEADLVDVWIYTHDRWGEAQAERYFDELETGINRLARNPELAVRIVRVLHDRMDPARRL